MGSVEIEFEELTPAGRLRRLRRLAEGAVEAWRVDVARWRCLGQAENACWRIETAERGPDRAGRFLLRVHRPGYQDARTLPGEAAWLESLRPVFPGRTPAPLRARGGAFYVLQSSPGVPEPRWVSILRWVDGRHGYRDKSPARCEALGAFQARLHQQAQGWRPRGGTRRRDWAWRGLFTDVQTRRIPRRRGEASLEPLDRADAALVRRGLLAIGALMEALGRGREAWGMIHGDLHFGNCLFSGTGVGAIDFDDCGPGHFAYDSAVTLWGPSTERGYASRRAAYLRGYRSIRPLSEEAQAAIDTMVHARTLRFVLRSCHRLRSGGRRARHARSFLRWALTRLRRWMEP